MSVSHFVCIRVDDKKVCNAIKELQTKAISIEKNLQNISENITKLHITLDVVNLKTQACEQKATAALNRAIQHARRENIRPSLEVRGVNNFNDKVVYADVTNDPAGYQLYRLADLCREYLSREGIERPPDVDPFHPHITVFKVTKRHERAISCIPPLCYQGFTNRLFGYQPVSSIQLCAMSKKKDYPIVAEIAL